MKVDLLVQLFAMAAGQEGGGQEEEDRREGEVQLSQSLLIHTETETLDLAVSANILTHCLRLPLSLPHLICCSPLLLQFKGELPTSLSPLCC